MTPLITKTGERRFVYTDGNHWRIPVLSRLDFNDTPCEIETKEELYYRRTITIDNESISCFFPSEWSARECLTKLIEGRF